MAFDGNGNYVLPTSSFAQPVTGTAIDDTGATALWADLATALSLCTTNDGQTSSPTLTNPKILTKVLDTNGNEVLEFGPTGSAVNHVKFINAATGNVPTIQTAGEADIGLDIENSEGEELLKIGATATAVNEITITNSATGNAVTIAATGDDTNIDLSLNAKGTGGLITPTTLLDTNGNEWVTHVATGSAVNNVRITNAATGNAAKIDVTETNTNLELVGNGTGVATVNGLATKIVNIGDWNMDSTNFVEVAHGLTFSNIRHVSVAIRLDDDIGDTLLIPSETDDIEQISCDTTNVSITRTLGGTFDTTNFDKTSFNRGYITIIYAP